MAAMRTLIGYVALAWASVGFSAEAPVPIETFFSLPTIVGPQLSPDGTKIAYLFPKEGKLALGLFDRKTKEGRMILEGAKESVTFFFWKGNERIVFGGDIGGNEASFIGVTDLTGKKVTRVAESFRNGYFSGSYGGIIDALPPSNEEFVLTGVFVEQSRLSVDAVLPYSSERQVMRYNARTKAKTSIIPRAENYSPMMVDATGHLRFTGQDSRDRQFWYRCAPQVGSEMKKVIDFPQHGYAETWEPQILSADGSTLYLISREEHDRGALYAFNTATGERGEAIFVPPTGEIGEVILSEDRQRLLGVACYADKRYFHWFDKARAELQQTLENTFKGASCSVVSSSADEQTHLVYVGSDRDPGTYYLLDLKGPALVPFKRIRPDVDPAKMRPMEPVQFAARDGLEIHAYLTRPAKEGAAPMVLVVHGGPFGVRDYWGYDNEAQFLTSRGYAVLQVNYRGSGGYGRSFIDKGARQWGRAMQDDLTDAVKWAIAQGVADPARVAIYGGSYGGYAALAGVTLTPELYRCAINYVGVAKLEVAFKGYGGDAFTSQGAFNYQSTWVAPDAAYAAEKSPVNLVENIRVPTMHAYGMNDPRVDYKQWLELKAQLDKFKKPYTAIVETDQGHGFRNEGASIKFYRAMEEFFAKNL